MLPPQMRRAGCVAAGRPDSSRQAAAGSQDSSQQITAEWFGQTDVYSRMREVIDAANRNNTSFYSLDPRGLAPFEYGFDDLPSGPPPSFATDSRALRMTQDTLRSLSEETDGKAIVNRNTLEQGLTQVVRDSSYYYLLGYTSQARQRRQVPPDHRAREDGATSTSARGADSGPAHPTMPCEWPIRRRKSPSRCRRRSPRSRHRCRPGKYVRTWIGTRARRRRQDPRDAGVGAADVPAGRSARTCRTRFAARRHGWRQSRVSGPGARASDRPGRRPPDRWDRRAASAAPSTPAPQRLTFDAAPGKVELRITVEGATGGTLDPEIRDIEVPDFTSPQVTR